MGDGEGCGWDGACVQKLGEASCDRSIVVLGERGCFFWRYKHAKVIVAAWTRAEEEEQPRCLQIVQGGDGLEQLRVLGKCLL